MAKASLERFRLCGGSADFRAAGSAQARALRGSIAVVVAVPAAFVCIYFVRFAADLLARVLPSRVAERLFPSTPNPTGVPVGDEPLTLRKFLAMAFLMFVGRYLFHSVRGWLRRGRLERSRISDGALAETTVADPTTTGGQREAIRGQRG
jgi:hypothetical protein